MSCHIGCGLFPAEHRIGSSVPPSPGISVGIGLSLLDARRGRFDPKVRVGAQPGKDIWQDKTPEPPLRV